MISFADIEDIDKADRAILVSACSKLLDNFSNIYCQDAEHHLYRTSYVVVLFLLLLSQKPNVNIHKTDYLKTTAILSMLSVFFF